MILAHGQPYLRDSVLERLLRQPGRAVHSLPIILGAPAGAVDVDVIGVEAERLGFDCIRHLSVQHAHTWGEQGALEQGHRAFILLKQTNLKGSFPRDTHRDYQSEPDAEREINYIKK